MKGEILGLLAVGLATGPMAATATTIFSDDFNNVSQTFLNSAPSGWELVADTGTVDTIRNGDFSVTCLGNTGGCVDLDGSTNQAGNLRTTSTFAFVSGISYALTAYLSGNQRTANGDELIFGISDGSTQFCVTNVTVAGAAPFAQYTCSFTAASSFNAYIFFDNAGGDLAGAILDDVRLESREDVAVPEPGTLALLGLGLAGLGLSRRRKSA